MVSIFFASQKMITSCEQLILKSILSQYLKYVLEVLYKSFDVYSVKFYVIIFFNKIYLITFLSWLSWFIILSLGSSITLENSGQSYVKDMLLEHQID